MKTNFILNIWLENACTQKKEWTMPLQEQYNSTIFWLLIKHLLGEHKIFLHPYIDEVKKRVKNQKTEIITERLRQIEKQSERQKNIDRETDSQAQK